MHMRDNIERLNSEINKSHSDIYLLVQSIISEYCSQLDECLDIINQSLTLGETLSDIELESYILDLSTSLYYASEGQESLGIKEDLSKTLKLNKYNEAHTRAIGTIADKQAEAEQASHNEAILQNAYSRAYKIIKNKVEQGNEVLQCLKKIITKRTNELLISSQNIPLERYKR